VNVLLDTHAVLWALTDDPRLGKKARKTINETGPDNLAISDMTLLEIALLTDRGRISLSGTRKILLEEVATAFRVLSINPAIAGKAMTLNVEHADPFDRVIAATAWHHKMILLTRDRHLTACPDIRTLW
jgi:PIN domain nuclease of toxin-antitoxin system